MLRLLFILIVAAGLVACGGTATHQPAPVESRTHTPPSHNPPPVVVVESTAQVYAYQAPQPMYPQLQASVPQPLPSALPDAVKLPIPSAPIDTANVPSPISLPTPSVPAPAVQPLPLAANNLLKRAKAQQQMGKHAAAAANIERGLRIAPRNAVLWHELAALRAQQQRHAEVEQLAAKSNALAGRQYALKNKNWQLIAQARAAQGDHAGAAYARQQFQP